MPAWGSVSGGAHRILVEISLGLNAERTKDPEELVIPHTVSSTQDFRITLAQLLVMKRISRVSTSASAKGLVFPTGQCTDTLERRWRSNLQHPNRQIGEREYRKLARFQRHISARDPLILAANLKLCNSLLSKKLEVFGFFAIMQLQAVLMGYRKEYAQSMTSQATFTRFLRLCCGLYQTASYRFSGCVFSCLIGFKVNI